MNRFLVTSNVNLQFLHNLWDKRSFATGIDSDIQDRKPLPLSTESSYLQ